MARPEATAPYALRRGGGMKPHHAAPAGDIIAALIETLYIGAAYSYIALQAARHAHGR